MASFNKVILLGNLTRNPEMRVTPGGTAICKIGLAVNRYFTTKEGERREETLFVDCDAFGKQAETISKYISKGQSIMVEGRLRLDQWETQQGEKRTKLSVVIENFQFVGGRGDAANGDGGGAPYERSAPQQRQQYAAAPANNSYQEGQSAPSSSAAPQGADEINDDVPF